YWKDDYTEFYLELDKQRLLQEGLSASDLFASLQPLFMHDFYIGSIVYENQQEYLRLTSTQHTEYDIWSLLNCPLSVRGKNYKLTELAHVIKTQAPKKIAKENQEYVLCLQYDYLGSAEQGKRLQKNDIETLQAQLPMGYIIEGDDYDYYWGKKNKQQYWLLALIVVIIFFTTSILFNSLKQPLSIIFVIPISYIGVFLTFYWWSLDFDQGGFASFVLLCGISVNACIYILDEYNNQRTINPSKSALKAYIKAWNIKIIPIILTNSSTILGFIPFLVGSEREAFWFPLAAGTVGGLIASIIGLVIYLPIFSLKCIRNEK
ncbi:MAG: efflux RND transporter permease subunit, partial [Bacteroidales bacterium]|nr:efflux RND transporter permease subunit [Bacteroidales bacterium]